MVIKRVPHNSSTFQKFDFGAYKFQKPVSGIFWNFVWGQKCHIGNTRVPTFYLFVTDGHKKGLHNIPEHFRNLFLGQTNSRSPFLEFHGILLGGKSATLATPGCQYSVYLLQMVIKSAPQHS
jgi:hypothetical protein